jgi:hypothetical protein
MAERQRLDKVESEASYGGGGEVNETPLAQIFQWKPSLSTL